MTSNTVVDIAAGHQFSVFVTRNRANEETEVFACGQNLNGELGVGYTRHVLDVTKIESLSNFKFKSEDNKNLDENITIDTLSCGRSHCMALMNVGAIFEWGSNVKGQMGNKKRVCAENPLLLTKFKSSMVRTISCGYDNSAIVTYATEKDKSGEASK